MTNEERRYTLALVSQHCVKVVELCYKLAKQAGMSELEIAKMKSRHEQQRGSSVLDTGDSNAN